MSTIFDVSILDQKLENTAWAPIDIAKVNDQVIRAACFYGEYHWHSHQYDEMFFVLKGQIVIDTENGPIELKQGQISVVPKGVQHKPSSKNRSIVLMFEPLALNSKGD